MSWTSMRPLRWDWDKETRSRDVFVADWSKKHGDGCLKHCFQIFVPSEKQNWNKFLAGNINKNLPSKWSFYRDVSNFCSKIISKLC